MGRSPNLLYKLLSRDVFVRRTRFRDVTMCRPKFADVRLARLLPVLGGAPIYILIQRPAILEEWFPVFFSGLLIKMQG